MNAAKPAGLDDARGRAAFRRALLAWYDRNARDLPWRRTRDPYRVWLSEIMLQQTQAATAAPYFERFVAALPTAEALAAAPLERVLKLWEGLGYYSRARNLHRAAQQLSEKHNGDAPQSAAEWRLLPGVGRYTAAAIASITRDEPAAVLDGNVTRVLARLLLIGEPIDAPATVERLWCAAQTLLDPRRPGDFNQAMMELGAAVCTPRSPRCPSCPVAPRCAARAAGLVHQLPQRRKRKAQPTERAAAFVVRCRDRVLLIRRPETGLLAGLWGWPSVALERTPAGDARHLAQLLYEATGLHAHVGAALGHVEHAFTHKRLALDVFAATAQTRAAPRTPTERVAWLRPRELDEAAMARVDQKVRAAAGL